MATFHELTTGQLKQALQIREQIESLQQKLETLLGGTAPSTKSAPKASGSPVKRRKMSAAGRAKIAAAQKARWAKVQGKASTAKTSKKSASTKSGVTDERRAKLSAAMKARWAERKKTAASSAQ